MNNLKYVEDYFLKIHKNFGISQLSFNNQRLDLDENAMKQLVFTHENFDEEFDNLLDHCRIIYKEVKKGFLLKINKDVNNNYFVNII